MKKLFAVGLVGLTLSACASAGTNYDQNAVSRLRQGDDIRSVVAALGRPNAESVDDKGNTVLVWVHSTASMLGAEVRTVRLTFDPQGKLVAVPGQPAVTPGYTAAPPTIPPTPQIQTPRAIFSEGVTGTYQGDAADVLQKARTILEAEGFPTSSDFGPTWLMTQPMPFELRPEHADCGRSFGIPYLMDRRAKSTVAYRVSTQGGELKVQVSLASIYEPGYGVPSKSLACTSSGVLEKALVTRLTA